MSDADKILAEMLEAVPNTYQKTVGFPTWDWLAAASIPIAQTEAELEEARRQLDPANLTGEALEAYIFPRTGQRRTAATCAVGNLTATGNGTIPAGALFESGGGVQFEATETVVIAGAGTVSIRCVTPGAAGDLPAESITMMPVQIAGIVSVTNEEPTAGGIRGGDGCRLLPAVPAPGADPAHQREPIPLPGVGHGGVRGGRRPGVPPGPGGPTRWGWCWWISSGNPPARSW